MDDHAVIHWTGRAESVEKWATDKIRFLAMLLGIPAEQVTSDLMRRHRIPPDEVTHPTGHNLLLDQGRSAMLRLAFGTSAGNAWNNANGFLGVGNGTVAAAKAQTGLQGANTAWVAFNASNPVMAAGATVLVATIAADFASGTGEFAGGWQEWSIGNASGGGTELNRAVDPSLGTGKSSELWTLNTTLTFS